MPIPPNAGIGGAHAKEVADALRQMQALTAVTDIAASTNIGAVPGSFADLAAVQTYLATAIPIIESRLDTLEGKVNTILARLRTAGIVSSS